MSEKLKEEKKTSKAFEVVLAILLALTALGMAWATWMSQLHASNEAQNYATSAALRAEGSSLLNTSALELSVSLSTWNELVELESQRKADVKAGDIESAKLCKKQINYVISVTCDDELAKKVKDALAQDPTPNVFDEETVQSYYDEANSYLDQAEDAITAGNEDNMRSDAFAFVNVLYSIVLFLMAFIGIHKEEMVKRILVVAGAVVFVVATVYMVCLPLPTNFDFLNYFRFALPH